ncbi:hypothetical protein GOBAR_AA22039 [Gossypium barbadense]|uniref:Uncharacterized protein n=1 Tax=Gossypium barbadense TaxID=3634 RepID=A0A2P5X5Q7_GOSBA|nr:hypothetical protein GOBAR_AA22039 [Gossypium barbadense]
MKSLHELDERVVAAKTWVLVLWEDIISNVLGGLLLSRLGEMILRRVQYRILGSLAGGLIRLGEIGPCWDIVVHHHGKGGEFSRWDPRKMTLPSFFLKLGTVVSFPREDDIVYL